MLRLSNREQGAQAVELRFLPVPCRRCEPVPQQLFVFLGRLYDVQPVGNPEQPERQYLLPFISWLKYSMVCESPSLAISCWVLSAVAKSPASPAEA